MTAFLEKTANHIYRKYGDKLSDLCIVVPNKRAGLFFKSHLAKNISKPFFAPEFYSIEEFVTEISGLQILDNISLLFLLYEVHMEKEGEKAQEFEKFLTWGYALLSDFNELDKYLVAADKLFSYLNEAKALSIWNLNERPLTDFEKDYLRFYNGLYDYYTLLNQKLVSCNQAYQGLAYRKVAEKITGNDAKFNWEKIIFIGFNALSKAEEQILHNMIKNGKAEVFWDADFYYLDNVNQESGKFLRKYLHNWNLPEFNWINNDFKDSEKEIQIIGVPLNIGQVKITGQILSDLSSDEQKQHQTAVVLSDESLLAPLLNSIPENISAFNVTMGLNLKFTPLYTLFNAIFRLHDNAERFGKTGTTGQKIYYIKDILNILQHPLIRLFDDTGPETSSKIINNCVEELFSSNKIFITINEFFSFCSPGDQDPPEILTIIFKAWDNAIEVIPNFLSIINSLRDKIINKRSLSDQKYDIDLEYLFAFTKVIKQLKTILNNFRTDLTIKSMKYIFNSVARYETIPFYGEPLRGVQIMGMLETRTLDFENVILLSANEGILPAGKVQQSFIPYDIKKEFGLPVFRDKDAIFGYHFYRLLQRARNVYLIYNTEADALGGGDKSRFIKQIQYELENYNPCINITEKYLSGETGKQKLYNISIPKSGHVIQKLKEKALSGFSPSSISTFIQCPFKFYLQELMQIREPEEIEESIDAATLGTVVHTALHNLFSPVTGKEIKSKTINVMKQKTEEFVQSAFEKHYKGGETGYGKNLLITRVAVKFINDLLNHEEQKAKQLETKRKVRKIKCLENFFKTRIVYPIDKENNTVTIKGKVDRIDDLDGQYYLIDYKTGVLNAGELKFSNWEDLITNVNSSKILQLLIYAYLFIKNQEGEGQNVIPGIFSLRKPSKGVIYVKMEDTLEIDTETAGLIEQLILSVIKKIFDSSEDFIQTTDQDNCRYCAYQAICNRVE